MKAGLDRDRARDADALALAAGELARDSGPSPPAAARPGAADRRPGRAARCAEGDQPERVERLGDDLGDACGAG